MCRILYKVWFITRNYHAQIVYTKSLYIYYIYIYTLSIYIYYIYIYTTFIYMLHLYIYYTIFSVEKCQDELEYPKKIPTRLYFLQSRDTSLWYISKIESRQNLLSRPDFTNSLAFVHDFDFEAIFKMTLFNIFDYFVSFVLCTDSKSLYNCLIKLDTTQKKRFIINVMSLRQLYERRKITKMKWIHEVNNSIDFMIKSKTFSILKTLIDINTINLNISE
jgi:hypothetical protein